FAEWRRPGSSCRGALVWFLRDLECGAGWGLIGADGVPKAAYYYLRRALQPCALSLSDEGCNGLYLHAVNETALPIPGGLERRLFKDAGHCTEVAGDALTLAPRSSQSWPAAAWFAGFRDLSYAFRFGPPDTRVVVARFAEARGATLAEAFHFPAGL